MNSIEVPEVKQTDGSTSLVNLADMVLTSLFSHAPAMLFAECDRSQPEQPVVWYIRPLRQDSGLQEIPIAVSGSCSHFRTTLARFGHHYMNNQLYGGHTRCNLSQCGQKFNCRIFMSNEGSSDFWIRVYAHASSQEANIVSS